VGTKRQAQEAVAEEARRCGMYFVNHRWLGGTLTNWATLQKSIKRLKTLNAMVEDGRMAQLSKKESARLDRERKHLHQNLEGVENMTTPPDAMVVIDSHTEMIAVRMRDEQSVHVLRMLQMLGARGVPREEWVDEDMLSGGRLDRKRRVSAKREFERSKINRHFFLLASLSVVDQRHLPFSFDRARRRRLPVKRGPDSQCGNGSYGMYESSL
jgi:hypothetical protein